MSATEQTTDAANDRETLHELLESFDTVMLITQELPEHGGHAATKDDFEVTSGPIRELWSEAHKLRMKTGTGDQMGRVEL